MMMTACSSDEVIEMAQTKPIGFDTFVNKSTRATAATDVTTATLTKFEVWGVTYKGNEAPTSIFVGQDVTLTDGAWTYNPLRYWIVGNSYRFSALAPIVDKGLIVEQNVAPIEDLSTVKGGIKVTLDNSADGTGAAVDLCFAYNTVPSAIAAQLPVVLDFKHMLSRVKFTFENNMGNQNILLQISDIQIKDAIAKATIDKHAGEETWTQEGTTTTPVDFVMNNINVSTNPNAYIANTSNMETEHMYIIPVAEPMTYNISFKIALVNFDTFTKEYTVVNTYTHGNVTLPATTFQPNFSYNFVAKINPSNIDPVGQLNPIQFNPSVTPWNDFNDTNIVFPEN